MSDIRDFLTGSSDHLGGGSANLLRAVDEALVAKDQLSGEVLRRRLSAIEGKPVSDATFRQRLVRLNKKLNDLGAPFTLAMMGGLLVKSDSESSRASAELDKSEELLEANTSSATAVTGPATIRPRAAPTEELWVMFSYGWLPEPQQGFQIDIYDRIARALRDPPHRHKDLPPIKIWRDERNQKEHRPLTPQLEVQCKKSFACIAMLSGKFESSAVCQKEIGHFLTKDGKDKDGKSTIVIGMERNKDDAHPRYSNNLRIIQMPKPSKTVVQTWPVVKENAKDQFVKKIAELIFDAAREYVGRGPTPPPSARRDGQDGAGDLDFFESRNFEHDPSSMTTPMGRRTSLGLPSSEATGETSPGIDIVKKLVSWAQDTSPLEPRLSVLLGEFGR